MAGKEGNDSTETNSSIADATTTTTTATAPADEKVQPTEEAESTVETHLGAGDKEKAESNAESDEEVESETNIEINTAEITTASATEIGQIEPKPYRDDEPILRQARNERQQQLQHNQTSAPVTHSVNNYPKNNSRTDSPSPQPQERENSKKGNNGDSGRGKNGGQVISGNLSLSPSYPPDVISDSKNVLSPMSCQSNAEDTPQI